MFIELITSIGFVIVILLSVAILFMMDKQARLKTVELLNKFNKYGSQNNFSFSSQEILRNAIIGLDGVHRKILVLFTKDKLQFELIDLQEVHKCRVIKYFKSISMKEWKGKNKEAYCEKIELHFEMNGKKSPIVITFYDKAHNHLFAISELEQKAKRWETLLSKMINSNYQKIA